MLKLLRYVRAFSGGYMMRRAVSPGGIHGIGASPQEAYDTIPFWTINEYDDLPECFLQYKHVGNADPNECWATDSACEPMLITPFHNGCPATSDGSLQFDAVDLRRRDENGNPVEDGVNSYLFDSLCTTVSSGANTLVLSSGVFASWGYGTASNIGGPDTMPGNYIRGWQARNVKVIYDYESYFNFKQGE